MSDNTQDFKILIIGDASSYVAAAQKSGEATKKLKIDTSDLSDETKKSLGLLPPVQDELKKTGKAAGEADVSHRELRESMRELTYGYPELGEAARAVLNPMVAAAFGIAEAFNIWNERLKSARELLGGWELPDLTVHAAGVSAAAEAYDKLKTAVAGADTEFDSGASIFERQAKAIEAQLTATKSLIDTQKQKAIADLDLQRAAGQVSPGMYDARRAMIEQGANAATTQAEIDARNADLAAKRQEAEQIAKDSAAAATKAAGIQPGLNDEALGELINKAHVAVDAAKKQAEDFRQKKALAETMRDMQGLESFTPESIATQYKYDTTFGVTTNPTEQAKIAADAAQNAEDTQANLEEQARRLEKQRDERKKYQDDAARLAAEAEKKKLELKGEDDPNKVGSAAWQNAQAAAAQNARSDTGLENRATKDLENFSRDAAEYQKYAGAIDPDSIAKAQQAMRDMYTMVGDVMGILKTLADDHQNVSTLAQQVALMKRQIQSLPVLMH